MNIIQILRENEGRNRSRLFRKWFERSQKHDYKKIDQLFSCSIETYRPLRITYVMNHVQVCGGAKIILEHTNHLVERGHEVSIVCHDPQPVWLEVKAKYIQVPWQMSLAQAIPETDVVVCTVYDQAIECYLSKKAPVLLFEQGDTYIYDFDKYPSETQQFLRSCWSLPIPVLVVSKGLATKIYSNFDRRPQILHNALDNRFFYPKTKKKDMFKRPWRILFVGREQTKFKGIDDIRKALDIVKTNGYDFEAVWVAQIPPENPFEGELIINPGQKQLGDIYRSCDIYVSGSYYESFPLPPLEAMNCGCAVVSTNNAGILEYATDGFDCLLGRIGDPDSLANRIMYLFDHPEKMDELVRNGLVTAKKFSWDAILPHLEAYLLSAIRLWEQEMSKLHKPTIKVAYIPKGLSYKEARERINHILNGMQEEWCLFLVEGETIDEQFLKQLKNILSEPIDDYYNVQVIYKREIFDLDIVRIETRVVKRGKCISGKKEIGEILPLTIIGGSEGYFLSDWHMEAIKLYKDEKYEKVISLLKGKYTDLEFTEQAVCAKWLVIACLKLNLWIQAIQILRDAIRIYPTYSDYYYLLSLISVKNGQIEFAQKQKRIAEGIGTAYHFFESFSFKGK